MCFLASDQRYQGVVRGDDYVTEGGKQDLQLLENKTRERFEIKAEYLGPDADESQEVRVLNRVIRWTSSGIEYEADPRHQEIVIGELGLKDGKGSASPGVKVMPQEHEFEEELVPAEATRYRAITGKVNFLAQDSGSAVHSQRMLEDYVSADEGGLGETAKSRPVPDPKALGCSEVPMAGWRSNHHREYKISAGLLGCRLGRLPAYQEIEIRWYDTARKSLVEGMEPDSTVSGIVVSRVRVIRYGQNRQ